MDFNLLLSAFINISKGIPTTLSLVFMSSFVGVLLAILVNIFCKNKLLKPFIHIYVFFFRGTPLFLQLFLVYYGFGEITSYYPNIKDTIFWWFFKDAYMYALLAMVLNTGAYGSAIIKGALQSIVPGQIEAAKAIGFSKFLIFRRIIAPQAFYYSLPAYSNEIILLVKASSLASVVTVLDITGYMNLVRSETYSFYEPFFVAAVYYLIINYSIAFVFKIFEKRSRKWLDYSN